MKIVHILKVSLLFLIISLMGCKKKSIEEFVIEGEQIAFSFYKHMAQGNYNQALELTDMDTTHLRLFERDYVNCGKLLKYKFWQTDPMGQLKDEEFYVCVVSYVYFSKCNSARVEHIWLKRKKNNELKIDFIYRRYAMTENEFLRFDRLVNSGIDTSYFSKLGIYQ